jgi:predicted enzyme related to lactoylglutathione lyase
MSNVDGQYVWHDLMTTDVKAAQTFYGEIIGWKTMKWEGGDYQMWTAGQQPIGGVMVLPPEASKAGAPSHWIGYVAVSDVDATVKNVQKLGGKIYHQPQDIPTVGRFAVCADPQGAAFAVFKSLKEGMQPDRKATAHFGWAELNTTDWKAAWKFYSELFGWKNTKSMEMGPEFGTYHMFGTKPGDENTFGGMSNAANMMKAPPHWLHYINVPNCAEAAKRVTQMGGKVLNGPMDVPGGGKIAQCMDAQGAAFGLFAMV